MRSCLIRNTANAALIGVLLLSLQSCAPSYLASSDGVTNAYATSGVIPIQPYTRTIFSSSNF